MLLRHALLIVPARIHQRSLTRISTGIGIVLVKLPGNNYKKIAVTWLLLLPDRTHWVTVRDSIPMSSAKCTGNPTAVSSDFMSSDCSLKCEYNKGSCLWFGTYWQEITYTLHQWRQFSIDFLPYTLSWKIKNVDRPFIKMNILNPSFFSKLFHCCRGFSCRDHFENFSSYCTQDSSKNKKESFEFSLFLHKKVAERTNNTFQNSPCSQLYHAMIMWFY